MVWLPAGFSNNVSKMYLQLGVEVSMHQNLQRLRLHEKNLNRELSPVNIELTFVEQERMGIIVVVLSR